MASSATVEPISHRDPVAQDRSLEKKSPRAVGSSSIGFLRALRFGGNDSNEAGAFWEGGRDARRTPVPPVEPAPSSSNLTVHPRADMYHFGELQLDGKWFVVQDEFCAQQAAKKWRDDPTSNRRFVDSGLGRGAQADHDPGRPVRTADVSQAEALHAGAGSSLEGVGNGDRRLSAISRVQGATPDARLSATRRESILIDRTGRVRFARNGYGFKKKWADRLKHEIEALLGESADETSGRVRGE